ncbi:hypothetical protein GGR34_003689 [Microvirga flocculans]|uniref:Uncharacterized protein n=1 Tax=Microvirga flocculans TaxID=217168 RepID=A0A7W6IIA5_9HYPH|nr:hypothetical protein [Microvirga flocculans]MBB4042004.1 hypothetical protein [Microvirga flocculans]
MADAASTTRRAVLSAALAAPLSASLAQAAPGRNPDAELMRLGREWRAAQDRAKSAPDGTGEAAYAALCAEAARLEFAIQAIPARTVGGLAVKAAIARQYAPERDDDGPSLDEMLTALVDDVLRLAATA